jgi:hypothetical protein
MVCFLRYVCAASITHRFLIINPPHRSHVWQMSGKAISRPTPWRTVVILCRKCGKKLDGGFGRKRKESLRTVLRETLRAAGRRRDVRICETSCLGLCPKGGVTALNATRPGTIHVIPAGAPPEDAMRTLLGGNAVADGDGIEAA